MRKPKIRFKGYTDDWEQRKFGEVAEGFDYGLNAAATEYDGQNKYIRITDIDDDTRLFVQDAVTSPDTDLESADNYILKKGDILFARTGASVGKTYIYREVDGLVYYAGFLIRAHVNEDNNADFVYQNTLTEAYNKYIQITSQRSGQPGVNAKEYQEFTFWVPDKKEQDRISTFLGEIDTLITLHQRKCDETKKLKKYMLQKMFPQNGTNVPEIRFDGFTDAWEQRKLGESLTLLKDGTHGTHADTDDGPLLLSAKNIKDGTIKWDDTDRRISQEEYEKIHSKFSLKSGDILLTIVGSIGETAILRDCNGLTFQRSVAFLRPDNGITSEFLYTEIQTDTFQKELENRKSTSAQPGIYLGDLAEIPVFISQNKDEQSKIGEYFENLDTLITLHQRKLEMLRKIKKSMLENMFV